MRSILFSTLLFFLARLLYAQEPSDTAKHHSIAFSGGLSATTEIYNTTDTSSSRDPFTYVLAGDFNVSYRNFNIPFSVMYSDRNFNYSQPFNRLGFSPQYKWIKLHLGYRSVTYSPFTLAGHSFLGAGVDLTPGRFRFGAVYGRFNKKTVPNTVNPLDTLITPTRKGYSLRLGVGSQKNYFDVIFLKICDDTTETIDTSQNANFTPQGNMVVGTHYKFSFTKYISWESEAALSLLTTDLTPYLHPADSNNYLVRVNKFFPVNQSSQYSSAISSSLQYNNRKFIFGLKYRRIDPNYQSFGAYYFSTDLENITVNSSIRLFKKKLMLRGSAGVQRDNLRNNKSRGSRRVISMFNFDYNSGKIFGINGNYSNYSVTQFAGTLPLNDTIKLYQSTRNMSIMPRLTFSGSNLVQLIQCNVTVMDLVDHNAFTAANTKVHSTIALLSYIQSYKSIGAGFSLTLNRTLMSTASEDRKMTGISIGGNKTLLGNKLNISLNASDNKTSVGKTSENYNGNVITLAFNAFYRPFKNHSFRASIYMNSTKYPDNPSYKSYTESKIIFGYVYNF